MKPLQQSCLFHQADQLHLLGLLPHHFMGVLSYSLEFLLHLRSHVLLGHFFQTEIGELQKLPLHLEPLHLGILRHHQNRVHLLGLELVLVLVNLWKNFEEALVVELQDFLLGSGQVLFPVFPVFELQIGAVFGVGEEQVEKRLEFQLGHVSSKNAQKLTEQIIREKVQLQNAKEELGGLV